MKKQTVTTFNEHFPYLWDIARNKCLSKSGFMEKCGFAKQRFSHWTSGAQSLTGRRFLKLMEGLALECEDFEYITKRQLSPEQREEIQILKWERRNKDLIKILMVSDEKTKNVRDQFGL